MAFTKISSDQALYAWMATKFYSVPLVVEDRKAPEVGYTEHNTEPSGSM